MFMQKYFPLSLLLALATSATAAPADQPAKIPPSVTVTPAGTQHALPTPESIKSLVDNHQYKDAIHDSSLLLDNRAAAGSFDRHAILMCRAECQLQLLQYTAARATLDLAKKEALAAGSDDDVTQADALSYLILKSPSHLYTPVTGAIRKPFDILDPSVRESAAGCLFGDVMALCEQKHKAAKSTLDILPILQLSREYASLRALDKMTNHDTKRTDDFAREVAKSAADIIDHNLADYESKMHVVEEAADKWVTRRTTTYSVHDGANVHEWTHHAGPTSLQISAVTTIKRTCEDLSKHIADLSQIFSNPDAFVVKHHFHYWMYHDNPDLTAAADDVRERANEILTKDYSR